MRLHRSIAAVIVTAGLAVPASTAALAQSPPPPGTPLKEINFFNRTEVTVLFTAQIIKPGAKAVTVLVDAQCVKAGQTKIWNVEAADIYYVSVRVVDPDCDGPIRWSNALTAKATGNSVGLHLVIGFLQWK
jgi:hypothetical protein